eukprot:TRINITY_DN6143_c0_g1_i1.p1 TRINITY_DN6143_c0_g1~~TRINITY_DN6143_c0_g1_i1.p1  ORF type:complete len:406 (+),score=96.63 TRINITY_DN6143_c0_g1_i1:213-1430(+)
MENKCQLFSKNSVQELVMESDHSESEEGRIEKLIREAHAAVDAGLLDDDEDDCTFYELQQASKNQMISDGWTAASDAAPNLPPMRPPPLLPPTIAVPSIFTTKVDYDTSHMFNQDLTEDSEDNIVVHNAALLEKYEMISVLGSGATSEIKLARDKSTGKEVAIKIVNSQTCVLVPASQWRELPKIVKTCQSPNTVNFLESFEDDEGVYVVLERLPGPAFQLLSKREGIWTEADASRLLAQVLKALRVLDKQGLVHADVVPANILAVDEKVSHVKLSGFMKAVPKDSALAGRWTSTKFKAPEVLSTNQGSPQVDMWGLGCVAFLLTTGTIPFNSSSELLKEEVIGGKVTIPEYLSPLAKDFLSGLLNPDPTKRLTLRKARKHDWIKKHGTETQLPNFQEQISKFQG